MLLVAKMVGQLGMHRTLYKSTRQLLQQALFADQVLRSLVIRKQLVDDSFVDSHTSLLVLRNLHLHKILNTLTPIHATTPVRSIVAATGTMPSMTLSCWTSRPDEFCVSSIDCAVCNSELSCASSSCLVAMNASK